MKRDSNSILMLPRFDPAHGGHGGNLRSAQIVELCADAGFPPRLVARGESAAALEVLLRGHAGARILLWEHTPEAASVPIAKELGFTVLALPQNVETLLGTPGSADQLGREVEALSAADRVVCIAEEESWLLANLGLPSDFLPYYPTRAKCQAMEAVARRRELGIPPDAPWVVLGSADHPPTREGMRALLRWLQPGLREGMKVVVGGFGTERLAAEFSDTGVRFLGALSGPQLEDLVAGARGILVHQDRGAGALTRIPEVLIARVPVVASRIAARSTRGYDGISVYDSQEELLALLRAGAARPGRPVASPLEAMGRFTALLRSAAERHG
jgi:hypothetical protein